MSEAKLMLDHGELEWRGFLTDEIRSTLKAAIESGEFVDVTFRLYPVELQQNQQHYGERFERGYLRALAVKP